MDKTVLQIPVSKTLRMRAEKSALDQGFSSLQEIIRVFMSKLASKTIEIGFREGAILSPEAEKRYLKMDQDFKMGKNIQIAHSVNELMDQLKK